MLMVLFPWPLSYERIPSWTPALTAKSFEARITLLEHASELRVTMLMVLFPWNDACEARVGEDAELA